MIVCISGKRRTGKSTLAELLRSKYGFFPISLAAPLKALCMQQFGLSSEQVDGNAKEHPTVYSQGDKWLTARDILIQTGQFYRSIQPNFWIDKLMAITDRLEANYVIPDVRFINELKTFKTLGAYLVRLERDEEFTGKNIDDSSETELDTYPDWHLHVKAEFNKDMTDLERIAARIKLGVLGA